MKFGKNMSKIGEKSIKIQSGVEVSLDKYRVTVKGPQGTLSFPYPDTLDIKKEDDTVVLKRLNEDKKTKSKHGLIRQLIANALTGVVTPWIRRLEVVGTGFNVKPQGEDLILKVGYSHPVVFKKVEGIKFQVEGNNKIIVSGADRQLVGQTAYQIKLVKKPDPYKGKGVRYEGEQLHLKPGKKVKAAGAAA